jgi:hypothetical protein
MKTKATRKSLFWQTNQLSPQPLLNNTKRSATIAAIDKFAAS